MMFSKNKLTLEAAINRAAISTAGDSKTYTRRRHHQGGFIRILLGVVVGKHSLSEPTVHRFENAEQ